MAFEDMDATQQQLQREIDEQIFQKGGGGGGNNQEDTNFYLRIFLLVILATFLINIPMFILSIIFFTICRYFKIARTTYAISIVSSILLGITINIWGFKNLLQFLSFWRKLLPDQIYFLERLIQNGIPFSMNHYTLVMTLLLALSYTGVIYFISQRLFRNWLTFEKEEKEEKYLQSYKYKKIRKNKRKYLREVQMEYRTSELSEVCLGMDTRRKSVRFNSDDLYKHVLVQGTTGTGKTYVLYTLLEDALKEGKGGVYVDGKGDPKTVKEIRRLVQKYKKKLYVFSDDSILRYNPVKHGKPTAITERLMAVMDWSEQFYENESENLLQQIISFLTDYVEVEKTRENRPVQGEPLKKDLKNIHRFLSWTAIANYLFVEQCEEIIDREYEGKSDDYLSKNSAEAVTPYRDPNSIPLHVKYMRMFFGVDELTQGDLESIEEMSAEKTKYIQGLRTQLEKLIYSDLGEKFIEEEGQTINIEKILKEGNVVVFSLDSNNYNSFIGTIGRFIISDCAYVTTQLYGNTDNFNGVLGLFDEFGSYGNDNILDILSKARSAKFGAVLGIQSISDLANKRRNIDIKEQTIDNCNIFILGRTNSPTNAEEIANLIGTYKDIDRTVMTENQFGAMNRLETKGERGTVRKVNKYSFNPDNIKYLPDHEFFYVNKNIEEENKKLVFIRNVFEDIA